MKLLVTAASMRSDLVQLSRSHDMDRLYDVVIKYCKNSIYKHVCGCQLSSRIDGVGGKSDRARLAFLGLAPRMPRIII